MWRGSSCFHITCIFLLLLSLIDDISCHNTLYRHSTPQSKLWKKHNLNRILLGWQCAARAGRMKWLNKKKAELLWLQHRITHKSSTIGKCYQCMCYIFIYTESTIDTFIDVKMERNDRKTEKVFIWWVCERFSLPQRCIMFQSRINRVTSEVIA